MKFLTLSQRLTLVFTLLLLLCGALSSWMQIRSGNEYSQGVIQRLSGNLATQIASTYPLIGPDGVNTAAIKTVFDQTMAVNPSVEVYLLDTQGRIIADAAPAGHIKQRIINVKPINRLLNGGSMPIYGDDPRDLGNQKVFSAATLNIHGKPAGYLYVVLQGEDYNALANDAHFRLLLVATFRSMALVLIFGLLAGSLAFRWVTRPVRRLTQQVGGLDQDGMSAVQALANTPFPTHRRDEVALLQSAFITLAQRISGQWEQLSQQDRQRREFIANISHDLRTPLTSLHGYLETLSVKAESLTQEERRRYLHIALLQSSKVGQLAQALFELARLEYGVVTPRKEAFALGDLVQDVYQKFELSLETRRQRLTVDMPMGMPLVNADVSMMERVLTNLIDNAIRHTPDGGTIELRLWRQQGQVMVQLNDSGPGIPQELKPNLFERPSILANAQRHVGGLGLMIVRRILQLHDSDITLLDSAKGACFRFAIPLAGEGNGRLAGKILGE
ncbi:HAMP domain-containing sensor histidine kinase [Acerihabitans sp. TG2]|uniref:sensor histidine kinase n=1 Tax=Acerihabitans sp. TG2 TaxID=3096008 RepID=UPI002B23399C|nr:HAMP domain-containing sensor histidine kinase [Acerihabitans sp. TG2]MEA9392752.1 HAMP domain-containing sensor histidine kinase [Acerihabitans sp. TG2]